MVTNGRHVVLPRSKVAAANGRVALRWEARALGGVFRGAEHVHLRGRCNLGEDLSECNGMLHNQLRPGFSRVKYRPLSTASMQDWAARFAMSFAFLTRPADPGFARSTSGMPCQSQTPPGQITTQESPGPKTTRSGVTKLSDKTRPLRHENNR